MGEAEVGQLNVHVVVRRVQEDVLRLCVVSWLVGGLMGRLSCVVECVGGS